MSQRVPSDVGVRNDCHIFLAKHPLIVSVHPATRLAIVHSHILSELGETEDPHGNGRFQLDGEECTLDLSVGELRNAEGQCRLAFDFPRLL